MLSRNNSFRFQIHQQAKKTGLILTHYLRSSVRIDVRLERSVKLYPIDAFHAHRNNSIIVAGGNIFHRIVATEIAFPSLRTI